MSRLRKLTKTSLAATLGLLLAVVLIPARASAYQPVEQNMYVPANPGSCNKHPCVLYPKSAQLPSGRLVAAFEDSEGAVVGQTMPIFKSDDNGNTWQRLTNLRAPAYLTSDPAYAAYTSAWTNPFFYVLPQALGGMPAGTLLLASVVSGADIAPNPGGNGNRQNIAIVLHSSADQGATWTVRSIIAKGADQQHDPVWEPYLMTHQGRLVAYYSDEEEANFFSGADASREGGQILAHKTSADGITWSAPAADVGTAHYAARPGMTNVVPTSDGKWLMTFEYWGGGASNRIKVCADPLNCDPSSAGQAAPGWSGGSPVTVRLPDGRIVYNDADSSDVLVNSTGRSDGAWVSQRTAVHQGYSRHLQYVAGARRVLILSASWGASGTVGPVRYGEVDLGNSAGAYYKFINRASGQALSVNDAALTDGAPVIQWGDHNGADQQWHLWTLANGNRLIGGNRNSGRTLGIWQGSTADGAPAVQWVENQAADQQWRLVAAGAYYKVVNVGSGKVLALRNGSTAQGTPVVQWADTGALDQQWQLVQVS
ncbi:RICIN domain-containing protein [Actinoplanes sp. NPDC024001]|uniref:RICIN domain-containing protein n=1 Tax=Actinoplanes sp. NPDC024001 TaxID=3154598 RepID=UPI0033F66BB3